MNILVFCVTILVAALSAGVTGQDLALQDVPLLRTGRYKELQQIALIRFISLYTNEPIIIFQFNSI